MPLLSHTFLWSLPKAALALASLDLCERFHYVESLSIDRDVGFNVRLPWCGLVNYLSRLGADCEPKVVAGIRKLIDAVLHVRF